MFRVIGTIKSEPNLVLLVTLSVGGHLSMEKYLRANISAYVGMYLKRWKLHNLRRSFDFLSFPLVFQGFSIRFIKLSEREKSQTSWALF